MSKIKTIGPFNFIRKGKLKIEDLSINLDPKNTHLYGHNGVGKSTLLSLVREKLLSDKIPFAFIDQDYRKNWLWWKDMQENLSLSAGVKKEEVLKLDIIKRQESWLFPLLNIKKNQVFFAQESEHSTINLSGGQLQRVILLRELLHKPKIFLLDEGFSALDEKIAPEIIDWLLKEQEILGFQTISISHNYEFIKRMGGTIAKLSLDENLKMNLDLNKL